MFEDRKDAGRQLAERLEMHKGKDALVLAIPRGGVEVGYEVAGHLDADFSIVISRKLPFPRNPEAGFGAIAEDGSSFMLDNAELLLPEQMIEQIIEHQKKEIERRVSVLRSGKPLPEIEGKDVILVDDGIAMGSTMTVSIMLCRNKNANKVIVGAPVSGESVATEIGPMVDELVILEKPHDFHAVAQVYRNWYDVPDEEVLTILRKWTNEHSGS